MIRMNMCVDHESNGLICELPDCVHHLLGEWSKLGVDHQHAIGADKNADCPTLPLQRIEILTDFGSLDVSGSEVRLRLRECQRTREDKQFAFHNSASFCVRQDFFRLRWP